MFNCLVLYCICLTLVLFWFYKCYHSEPLPLTIFPCTKSPAISFCNITKTSENVIADNVHWFLYQAPLRLVWSAFARWLSGSHFHAILDKQLKSWLCALCLFSDASICKQCLLWWLHFYFLPLSIVVFYLLPSIFTLTSRSVLKTFDTSILGKHQLYWQENPLVIRYL